MRKITTKQLDAAAAAYARSTGTSVNRAGLRAAIHTLDLQECITLDKEFEIDAHYDAESSRYDADGMFK